MTGGLCVIHPAPRGKTNGSRLEGNRPEVLIPGFQSQQTSAEAGLLKLFTRERLLHHRFPFLAGEDTPQTPGALT